MLNGVEVLPFKVAAYNKVKRRMEFFSPGRSKQEDFKFISGTQMRNMAKNNEDPPDGFMSKKGWEVLFKYYRSLNRPKYITYGDKSANNFLNPHHEATY